MFKTPCYGSWLRGAPPSGSHAALYGSALHTGSSKAEEVEQRPTDIKPKGPEGRFAAGPV